MNKDKAKVFLLLLFLLSVFSACNLQVHPVAAQSSTQEYTFLGAFTEWGTALSTYTTYTPNVTVTLFGQNNSFGTNMSVYRFTMDSEKAYNYSTGSAVAFPLPYIVNATNVTSAVFDLGFNVTRTIYYENSQNESLMILVPAVYELYNIYTFGVIDLKSVSWGYLESLLTVNGTERVIERWDVRSLTNLPFVMTWGKTYNLRLVCNFGIYDFAPFTAGATQTTTLSITSDMFPQNFTNPSNVTLTVTRSYDNPIQFQYSNPFSDTTSFTATLYNQDRDVVWTYSATGDSISVNYNYPEADQTYYAVVVYNTTTFGRTVRTFTLPALSGESPAELNHPLAFLNDLGSGFPFRLDQVPAAAILIVIALAFSWKHLPIGILVEIGAAAVLIYLYNTIGVGLAMGWSWLTVCGCIGVLLAFAEQKPREQG